MSVAAEGLGCKRLEGPEAFAAWDAYCGRHPDATPYHRSAWCLAVAELRHESHSVYLEEDRGVRGVLPLFLRRSRLFGTNLVSVPAANVGGPLADDEVTTCRLVEAAIAIARDLNVDFLELRGVPPGDQVRRLLQLDPDRYSTVVIDLAEGEAAAWARLSKSTRRRVRQAQDAGLTFELGQDLDAFYPVYASSMKRLGSPPFSSRFFRKLREVFGEELLVGIARAGAAVAAVDLLLSFQGVRYSVFAGSRAELWHLNPNHFLLWAEVRDSCAAGLRAFDLGRSLLGSSALEFKRSWGGRELPLTYAYHLQRARRLPIRTPDMLLYRALGRVWSHLPDRVVTTLGPPLVRHLF